MRRAAILILILFTVVVLCGCQRSLFAGKGARTQFGTYDLLHQRYTPTEVPDVFGNPEPALRARLTKNR